MALSDYINESYLDGKKVQGLRKRFLSAKPFPHLELRNFLKENKTNLLRDALKTEQWTEKEADLFRLKHTQDIASSSHKALRNFRSFLLSAEFMDYMEALTGLRLNRKGIDLAGSLYEDTCYLLCHDDQLEGRKIAFLFYLSDMKQTEGGSLALLDRKLKTAVRIIPRKGTLAFFEVSPISFHEVEEVVAKKQRLALGGWLHG